MKKELRILIQQIDDLKREIEELRPIPPEMENKIMQKFRLDWNFHSNNIEGNQLSYGETKTFLLHGITANGKPLKDHLDIKGHNDAILLLEDIIKENRPITENFIRELHKIILKEPYKKRVQTPDGKPFDKVIKIGEYKKDPNHVRTATGEMFYFATPEETPAKMGDLIQWYKKSILDTDIHPLIVASLFHYKFIRVHPFDDGNGRLARILMNLILMFNGFPPVIIKSNRKEEYYRALQQADGGDTEFFVIYIGNELIKSMNLFLKGAKGFDIEDEDDIDKEIKLFKKELSSYEDLVVQSSEINIRMLENVIKPLMESVINKLKEFDELFINFELKVWINGKQLGATSARQLIDIFEDQFLTQGEIQGQTGFYYNFIQFKKRTKENFDLIFSMLFDFKHYDYVSIKVIGEEIYKVYYSNPTIETTQIKNISNKIARKTLDLIKNKVRETKNQKHKK